MWQPNDSHQATYSEIIQWRYTVKRKGKADAVPTHAMTAYRGTRGTTLLIFGLGARVRSVVNITSRPLHPPRKNPCTHRTGAPAWTFGRRDNYRTAVGIRSPNHPARRLLAILTELTRLVIRHCTIRSAAFRSYSPNGGISSYLCCSLSIPYIYKQKKQQMKWWKVVRIATELITRYNKRISMATSLLKVHRAVLITLYRAKPRTQYLKLCS